MYTEGGSPSVTSKATVDNFQVFATHNGIEKSFRGTISESSITIDLPANIDSWTNPWIRIYLDSGKSIQFNGSGTSYNSSKSSKITGVPLSSLNSILVKGDGYEDNNYSVTINKKLYVSYNKNYTGNVENWSSVVPSTTVLYSSGDEISLSSVEAERSLYRQLGWASTTSAETPEYDVSGKITVTDSMVNSGVLDLYVTWSKYYIGQLVENVTDVEGISKSGYVAYICSKNDSLKATSSDKYRDWTYLIVSWYGENRLSNVSQYTCWNTFKNGANGKDAGYAYLPTKSEMEVIIENLWNTSLSRQWKIFSDGSYAGNVASTQSCDTKLYAIGVSHIK